MCLFEIYKEPVERLDFICKSGPLSVSREGERLWLDFPAIMPSEVGVTLDVERALGVEAVDVLGSNELFVVLESEQAVLDCQPDMVALAKLPWPGAIVTARGSQHDFVSRYFAPAIGINEDPVTGFDPLQPDSVLVETFGQVEPDGLSAFGAGRGVVLSAGRGSGENWRECDARCERNADAGLTRNLLWERACSR